MGKVNVGRWRTHVEAAQAQGVPLARYAREHGLSPWALYAARQAMNGIEPKRRGAAPEKAKAASPFIPVQLAAPSTTLRVELPNGVMLHCSPTQSADWLLLIQTLAALPCSR